MHSILIDGSAGGQGDNSYVQRKLSTETRIVPVSSSGDPLIKGQENAGNGGWRSNLNDDDHAVLALRNLIFDLCNQNGGGHGGSAIGMSAIGVALFKHILRYNPSNSEWFDRDRFVLSNGECNTRRCI